MQIGGVVTLLVIGGGLGWMWFSDRGRSRDTKQGLKNETETKIGLISGGQQ